MSSISIESWKAWTQSGMFRELIKQLQETKHRKMESVIIAEDRDALANQVIGMDDIISQILALKGE